MNPIEKYHVVFAKDEHGKDLPWRFMLTTSEPFGNHKEKVGAAFQTAGIDTINPIGRYTIEVTIARTFDPAAVLEELKRQLDTAFSNIVIPKLVRP